MLGIVTAGREFVFEPEKIKFAFGEVEEDEGLEVLNVGCGAVASFAIVGKKTPDEF